MENGKVLYNNIDNLSDLEKEALDIHENKTKKELRNFFENHFEEQYDGSFVKFKQDLFQKAKGYSKIENKIFTNALDEAFKQSSVYDVEIYRKSKEIAGKYFTHLGKTKEAQDMILDYIANGTDIDSNAIMKANVKYFETQNVNHGLYAFPDDIYTVKGHTDNPLSRIDDNIKDIINDKNMELSLSSSEYMIGPIGVTGKTSPIAYHTNDIRSHLEFINDGVKRIYQPSKTRGTGTVEDIIDSLKRESTTDLFHKHDELIGKGLDIESLWVKEDFYSSSKDYVHGLMQKYQINNLDLIHASENTEKINPNNIERLNIKELNKPLTSQEAFDKYGPNDDKFYTSQGLDPNKQKEAVNKLNSKRKKPKPLPDYSADDARLDKMFAENKDYIESLKKQINKPKVLKLKNKTNNIIDKIFEFEDKYPNENHINFNDKNIKQEFEKLSKRHGKSYSELLYRPKEYRQELSKYYESLKSDIRPLHEIPKIIDNDIEPITIVENIFAQEHGFESYNDMLRYSSKYFDGKSSIPIEKILELKNLEKPTNEIQKDIPFFNKTDIKNIDTKINDIIYSRINNSQISQKAKDKIFNGNILYVFKDKNISSKMKEVVKGESMGLSYGFRNKDSMFINIHGGESGVVKAGRHTMSIEQLGEILTQNNLIPNDIKNIYTISCYGGLQPKITLDNGITIQSSHTSKLPIFGSLTADETILPVKADDDGYLIQEVKKSLLEDENFTEVFDTLDLDKYVEKYAKQQGYLTPEEAGKIYTKYDKNYYESQGIAYNKFSKEQRKEFEKAKEEEIIKKQSKIDKYTDKLKNTNDADTIKQLQEVIENEKNKINGIKNDNASIRNLAKEKEIIKNRPTKIVEQSTKETSQASQEVIKKSTKKISKDLKKNTTKSSKMINKSLNGNGKGAIGLIIAGVAGLAIGKALSSNDKDKKQDKQVEKQQNISYNNQYIDNQYAMQMAQDISSYRYGKHMTGFVNY